MSLELDDLSFENTAKAVWMMNESARERYEVWKDLLSVMQGRAYMYAETDTQYFSTGGYCLSYFDSGDGKQNCVATVMGYTAKRFCDDLVKSVGGKPL